MAHSDPKAVEVARDLLAQEARVAFIPVGEPCAGCGNTGPTCDAVCPERRPVPAVSIGTWCEGCGPHESLGVCSECGYAIEAGWVITDEMVERARRAYIDACNDERPQVDSLGTCLRAALVAALQQEARDA